VCRKKAILLVLTAIICFGGCTNTRYLTDTTSKHRQREMKAQRAGVNAGDVCLNLANMFIAAILNSEFEPVRSERTFKKISIYNQSNDSLLVLR
jgi:uncharacterized protein YceK